MKRGDYIRRREPIPGIPSPVFKVEEVLPDGWVRTDFGEVPAASYVVVPELHPDFQAAHSHLLDPNE